MPPFRPPSPLRELATPRTGSEGVHLGDDLLVDGRDVAGDDGGEVGLAGALLRQVVAHVPRHLHRQLKQIIADQSDTVSQSDITYPSPAESGPQLSQLSQSASQPASQSARHSVIHSFSPVSQSVNAHILSRA